MKDELLEQSIKTMSEREIALVIITALLEIRDYLEFVCDDVNTLATDVRKEVLKR